ncbi:chemotaxis protein CheB [Wenxinia marina]|uniref:Methylase of chemotaxis methyl-accepting protein n=1 Tax=Wenxinia marina DSM 24838 TaxID=1123501 RepID=A0A0D0NKG2_9RHOB|nr:chemotaxis protein CheB [Wenxinia marina]KIQ68805.1 Methylase of chemotaxis methyl-accepting protein [Wenxinia marina DSM 24838]GGL65099.1 chemotaxis protein CheR [Wenxinia marina]
MKDKADQASAGRPVIVGIGASAGGLEAFQDLFSRLPAEHGLALVLVQHLDPDHESLLPELIGKRTRTPVQPIEDGMAVEGGNIYLIPPGQSLTVEGGRFALGKFEAPRGQRRPIDVFLESLAEEAGPDAAAIILSGTGSDGAKGALAIKEAGGLVFAQDPRQARYDGMPRSAIATGAVDMSLRTEEMLDVLDDFYQRRQGIEPTISNDGEFVATVFKHLRHHTGHDFSRYKQATLLRRLSVRMSVLGISSPNEYVKRLIRDRDEASRLFRDVLINVTSFFRDPAAFEALRTQVIPELMQETGTGREVRIWVPGCSTGQEAYTLGMLVAEELSRTDASPTVAIFGTDIDEEALQIARAGIYPNSIADEVPSELLERYFRTSSNGYEVGRRLRDIVRFSNQSLVRDPPFSRLDLVSCRNVTIYFEKALQETAVEVFHYALKPGGFLFLGLSENPQSLKGRFKDVDVSNRIYRRNDVPAAPLNLPFDHVGRHGQPRAEVRSGPGGVGTVSAKDRVRDAILSRHAPPYVVLTGRQTVSYASPGAERYLRLKPGDLKLEIGALIHPALDVPVRRLVNGVSSRDEGTVAAVAFEGELDGERASLELTGELLPTDEIVVVFHSRLGGDALIDAHLPSDDSEQSRYIRELEGELDDARQTIRTTVEELETSNEELKSSNEEMMSMNEELQSANEELSTINEELQAKVEELNTANRDLSSYMESSALASVFLGPDLRLRRFTPEAQTFFRFVDGDIGRPLGDIASDLELEPLTAAIRRAQETGRPVEEDFRTRKGAHLHARIVTAPLKGADGKGVVFSLVDVSDFHRVASELEVARRQARANLAEVEELYRVSPVAMALFDEDLRYLRVNQKLAEINGLPIEAHYGKRLRDMVPVIADTVGAGIRSVFETGEPILTQEVVGRTAADGDEDDDRSWLVDYYPLRNSDGIRAVGINVVDVTQQKETREELRRVMRELQHRVKNMLSNVTALINRARRDDRAPDVVLDTLAKRIRALSETHSLLTAANWRSTSIRDLIGPELISVYGADVIRTRGPDVHLNARATLGLGLILHELATNAAKYGALSREGGQLLLSWARTDEGDGERLRLSWQEDCGTEIKPPERTGFGSTLIRTTAENTLDGSADFQWNPRGLRVVVEIDWERATSRDDSLETDLF